MLWSHGKGSRNWEEGEVASSTRGLAPLSPAYRSNR